MNNAGGDRWEELQKKYRQKGVGVHNSSLDNGAKSGIIKSIDVDDYKLLTGGKEIAPEVNDVILNTMKKCEKDGAECLAELEVLRFRKTKVSKELSDFYEKYMGRKYL